LCLFITQAGEGIDNNTENNVEEEQDNDHKEGEIV